jgi:hypothetical protein
MVAMHGPNSHILFIYLFCCPVGSSGYNESNDIVNNELEKIQKEAVVS